MDVRSELLRANQISTSLRIAAQLTAQGRTAEARVICERLLKASPGDAEIHNMSGVVAVSEMRKSEALYHFQEAVSRAPNNVGYLNNLGRLFMKLDRIELAIPVYFRIVKLDPQYATAIIALGEFFEKMGRAEKGLPYIDKFLEAKPDNPEVLLMRGRLLESAGRHSEAEEIYLQVEKIPELRVTALFRLASVKKHETAAPLLDRIDAMLALPKIPPALAGLLNSAAGKVLEDAGEYDQSFNRYRLAAESRRSEFNFAEFENRHIHMMKLFTPEFFKERRDIGNPSDLPVLVVGMPRSGTTLTEQIIARHPQAGGAGEQMRLRSMARTLGFKRDLERFVPSVRDMTQEQLNVLADNYLQLLRFYSKDSLRVVDKLPHNFEMLGFAATIFPNIHIVHCVRDPIDTCLSIYVNQFNESHGYANDLATLGTYYQKYAKLMDYWRSALPVSIYDSSYEGLTDEPEVKVRQLIDAVGLPWDDACLSHTESKATVMTLSTWQVRQPIYKTSVKRWKRYEKHLGPLIEALGDRAEAA